MAIQILLMTNDPQSVQGVREALEDRRARVHVHPLDESILVLAREAAPAAVLLDVSMGDDDALAIMRALGNDAAFEGTPIFGLFGSLAGATSFYEDLSQPTNAAAEILAIAELNAGFSDSSDSGIFDGIDSEEMDLDALIAPSVTSGVRPPPVRRPPPPPPRGGRTSNSSPAIRVSEPESTTTRSTPLVDDAPRRPRTTTSATIGSGSRETFELRDELNQRDREILELRSKMLELERALLERDDVSLEAEQQLDEMNSQLLRAAEALDQAREREQQLHAEVAAATDAAKAVAQEFEERKQEFQELLDAREAELIAESDQRMASLHEEYEDLIAGRVSEAVNGALEEAAARHNEALEAAVADAVAKASVSSELEEQLVRVSAQRDEVLQISKELESALALADQQVLNLAERVRLGEVLIEALRRDLAGYVEAAHQATSSQRDALGALASLATMLADASNAVTKVSALPTPELPATTWEEAYVAWKTALDGADFEGADTDVVEVTEERADESADEA